MNTVNVVMKDFWTGERVERSIDASVLSVNDTTAAFDAECNTLETSEDKQSEILNQWIKERANYQHDTTLELVSFSIV